MSEDIFEKALAFAVKAHHGAKRKTRNIPSILHPMECAAIIGSMSDDKELMAASLLHDTVEDTSVTIEQIEQEFGAKVARLVRSDTENKRKDRPSSETWQIRKEESLRELSQSDDIQVKMIWLADKLSNMRSFYQSYLKEGSALWEKFNQKDAKKQEWFYRTVLDLTKELKDFPAWQEYDRLVNIVFGGGE